MIKEKNGRDITEAEDIMKRWQEYTEELYQKDLDVRDKPDSVVADLEPDILEREVKWALESMANNKASGGDDICLEDSAVARGLEKISLHTNPKKGQC